MRRSGATVGALACSLLACLAVAGPASAQADAGLRLTQVGTFDQPVYVHGPPGANRLIFVVERRGVVRIVRGGRPLPGRFLDIRRRVGSAGREQGLLSIAFAPAYRNNRRFYVFYTDRRGDLTVEEYRRAPNRPRRARRGSARRVISIPHRFASNHNGGQLQFGPDRLLYISTGDGGGAGDPRGNAQNRRSLLGKILRINPRRKGRRSYTVPRGNPFVGRPGRREIYSLGLRNPWRFSFDRVRSRRIAIADVGQSGWEEVNYTTLRGARGANFGWNAFEGSRPFPGGHRPLPANHTPPIHEYATRVRGTCAITGGYVVRDPRLPSLRGRYLYADYCRGEIRSLVPRLGGARGDRSEGLPRQAGIASFGEDQHGRIYLANHDTGRVLRLDPGR